MPAETTAVELKVVRPPHRITFREQALICLNQMKDRKRKPIAPSTADNWDSALRNWINPNIGDMPLDAISNLAVKQFVASMVTGGLGPKSIGNYTQIVKTVVASAVNEEGEQLHPRMWNHGFIDMPVIDKKKQKTPCLSGEVVAGIVRIATGRYRMLFILCAAAGLRIGEALGIDIKNISPDCSTIVIKQKAWRGQIHERLKTPSGDRVIDVHPSVAALLQEYIGTRQSGLLFCSRSGKQLWQSNILRRHLHPILKKLEWKDAELGIDKAGVMRSDAFVIRTCETIRRRLKGFTNSGWDMPERECQACTTRSGMTWGSAKKLLKELVWASSFRPKRPWLDRMDRKSSPSQFWKWQ